MFAESKNAGSGQKRRVVPDSPRLTLPTASSFETTLPSRKPMFHSLPSRRTLHSRCFDKRVDHRHADAVQAAGTLVVLVVNFPPACRRVRISSTPLTFSFGWMSTGIPRPSSSTETEPSLCRVTPMSAQCPDSASSTLLSTTSCTRWFGFRVSVYMPGRRRTGSSPFRTSMSDAVYDCAMLAFTGAAEPPGAAILAAANPGASAVLAAGSGRFQYRFSAREVHCEPLPRRTGCSA